MYPNKMSRCQGPLKEKQPQYMTDPPPVYSWRKVPFIVAICHFTLNPLQVGFAKKLNQIIEHGSSLLK